MAHQNTGSATATAQNAATDPVAPGGRSGAEQDEPRSYVAKHAADASLAPPAAGETDDVMDEGDAFNADDVQQGSARADRPGAKTENADQGSKTLKANRDRQKG